MNVKLYLHDFNILLQWFWIGSKLNLNLFYHEFKICKQRVENGPWQILRMWSQSLTCVCLKTYIANNSSTNSSVRPRTPLEKCVKQTAAEDTRNYWNPTFMVRAISICLKQLLFKGYCRRHYKAMQHTIKTVINKLEVKTLNCKTTLTRNSKQTLNGL